MMSTLQSGFQPLSLANNTTATLANKKTAPKTVVGANRFQPSPREEASKPSVTDTVTLSATASGNNNADAKTISLAPATTADTTTTPPVGGDTLTLSTTPPATDSALAPPPTATKPLNLGTILGGAALLGVGILGIGLALKHNTEVETLTKDLNHVKKTATDLADRVTKLEVSLKAEIAKVTELPKENAQRLSTVGQLLLQTQAGFDDSVARVWRAMYPNAMENLPEIDTDKTGWAMGYIRKHKDKENGLTELQVLAKGLTAVQADDGKRVFSANHGNENNQFTMRDSKFFLKRILTDLSLALGHTETDDHPDLKGTVKLFLEALGTIPKEGKNKDLWFVNPEIDSLSGAEKVAEQIKEARLLHDPKALGDATVKAYEHLQNQLETIAKAIAPAPTA
jgi:hypothetical protein